MKLKKLKHNKLDFIVPLPKRLSKYSDYIPAKIRIGVRENEYMYIPKKHTFGKDIMFTSDELEAIVEELKNLNEVK